MVKAIFGSFASVKRGSDEGSESQFPMLSLEESSETTWCEIDDLSSYAADAFNTILPRKMAQAANAEDVFSFEIVQNIVLLCYEVGSIVNEEEFFYHFAETIDLGKLDWLRGFVRPEILMILSRGDHVKASDESWAVHAFVQNLLEQR